jgi:hypothetical protein
LLDELSPAVSPFVPADVSVELVSAPVKVVPEVVAPVSSLAQAPRAKLRVNKLVIPVGVRS